MVNVLYLIQGRRCRSRRKLEKNKQKQNTNAPKLLQQVKFVVTKISLSHDRRPAATTGWPRDSKQNHLRRKNNIPE